jgi:hydrogenase maturation protease
MQNDLEDTVGISTRTTALVVCVGNDLVADDGIGAEVYKRLHDMALPEHVRIVHLGVLGLDLLDVLTGTEQTMLIVDAVHLGAKPGTVHTFDLDELPRFHTDAIASHDIGIIQALEVGRRLFPERMPKTVKIIGVEGKCFNEIRLSLSEEAQRGVTKALELIEKELYSLKG